MHPTEQVESTCHCMQVCLVEIEHKLKAELYASMLDFIALNKVELLVGLRLKEYDMVPRASA